MSDEEDDTFSDTIEWATSGTDVKKESQGISLFYLIIAAIVIILLIIFLVVYFGGTTTPEQNINALGMMQNNDYVYDYASSNKKNNTLVDNETYVDDGYIDGGYVDEGYVDEGYVDEGYVDNGGNDININSPLNNVTPQPNTTEVK
jgi:hypothetical protein